VKEGEDAVKEAKKRILVIDDEENMRHMLSLLLTREGYEVEVAEHGAAALAKLQEDYSDLILCDLKMPVMDGMAFLDACQGRKMDATIIMMSAYGTIDIALDAMKRGAYDYIPKPFKPEEVILTLRKAEERERLRQENRALREALGREYAFENMVARSHAMQEIFRTVQKIGPFKTTVLLQGESGTGKELVARAIHLHSPRAQYPFVAVNCGAIPHQLLESELFGHVRGAFTDAVQDKRGLFVEAHGGTLFLDEVGELPKDLQVKLLRVLQDQEVRPVGGSRSHQVDVRILAATVKDLEKEVQGGRFRDDLFFRLNVVTLRIPPLRDRLEDIPLLVEHLIGKHRERLGVQIDGISKRALRRLLAHPWPGNVRELENAVERAMILCEQRQIDVQDLPMGKAGEWDARSSVKGDLRLRPRLRALEGELIQAALKRTRGNRTQAAKLLGITHRALMYKLQDKRSASGTGEDPDERSGGSDANI
jgi:two-component system response regulator AtoC